MTIKQALKREAYVALHAQTVRFRIMKYLVLLALGLGIYFWKGGQVLGLTFLVLVILSLAIHFLFRWKTKAWTESWGPYKKLELPE